MKWNFQDFATLSATSAVLMKRLFEAQGTELEWNFQDCNLGIINISMRCILSFNRYSDDS